MVLGCQPSNAAQILFDTPNTIWNLAEWLILFKMLENQTELVLVVFKRALELWSLTNHFIKEIMNLLLSESGSRS